MAARTGPGTFTEGTFEVAYDKLTPAQLLKETAPHEQPPDECVDFAHTNRDPFRVEEENRVNKIPNKAPRCHPLHGIASPVIIGAPGAGITGSPSHIGATVSRIAESNSS